MLGGFCAEVGGQWAGAGGVFGGLQGAKARKETGKIMKVLSMDLEESASTRFNSQLCH